MAIVTIKGTFNTPANNGVSIDVSRSNPNKYWFGTHYDQSFTKVLDDLQSGLVYSLDADGHTTGDFTIEVSGNVATPKTKKFNNGFSGGFSFKTT